jgi:membrane protease YdiL (CAAX protease family)
MIRNVSSYIVRYQLVIFFILAYALSWWPSLMEPHSILPLGPLVAALTILPLVAGKAGVLDFLRRIVQWRVGLHWYALALLLPVALLSGAVGLNLLLGAQGETLQTPALLDVAGTFLFILIFIGLGEEPAWRGFALPRLMAGRSALAASLLLGVLHAIWHLPLFGLEYDLQNGLPWFLGLMGFTIVTTWVYLRTNGNLLLPILMHTSVNVTSRYLFNLFGGADSLQLWWIWAALWGLAGIVIVIAAGPGFRRRSLATTPVMTSPNAGSATT